MPYGLEHNKTRLPRIAASAIGDAVPVMSSASQTDHVLPVGSVNQRVLGVSLASAASPGDPVSVQTEGIRVMRAAASVGQGAIVAIGSTNGRLIPAVAGASAPIPAGTFAVGESVDAAVDGDYFSVLIRPEAR